MRNAELSRSLRRLLRFCNNFMKAIQLEKPLSFRPIEIAEPNQPGPGEALVRIHRIGICGTDFGGYLGKRDPRADGTLRWVVEQGFEMGRPSLLEVEVDKRAGATTAVRVGGSSVLVSKGEMYL